MTARFLFCCVTLALMTSQLLGLVVKDVQMTGKSGNPALLFSFDEDFSIDLDQEDDETILVEFPEGTKWEAPLSKESPLGLSYTYVPYQGGAGDLIIRKDKNLVVGTPLQKEDHHYEVGFQGKEATPPPRMERSDVPLAPPPRAQQSTQSTERLGIKNVRVGSKDGHTRLVFDLTRPTKFIIKEKQDESKIYIIPTEITQWTPPHASTQSFGSFKGYRLVTLGRDIAIEVSVEGGGRILKAVLMDDTTPTPKLVMDLGPASSVPSADGITENNKITDTAHEMMDHNQSLLNRGDSFSAAHQDDLIQAMNMLTQGDDTVVRLLTSEVKNFTVQENNVTSEVTIILPKMSWDRVHVTETKAGLVDGFVVDQADPHHTKIVLKLQKGTSVMNKKSFGVRGRGQFVLYLNQKEKKTPAWLVSTAGSELSYNDLAREEEATSRLIYKGGILPNTNIGDGFYIGAKATSLSGNQKSKSSHLAHLHDTSIGHFGGGAHVLGGYGKAFDQTYAGLEVNAGIYGADGKVSHTVGGAEINSSSEILSSWGVVGRFGYYVSPTSLLYGRLGVATSDFSYGGSDTSGGDIIFPGHYKRKSRTGFLYGVGLESAVSDAVSVRIEGAQVSYQPFRFQQGASSKKDRPLFNEMNIGVAYKLSPMAGPAFEANYEESVGTGFYFGAEGGLATLMNHRHLKGTDGVNATVYDGDGATVDPAWGVFAGYGYHRDRFFLAGEAQLELTKPMIAETLQQAGVTTESYANRMKWLWSLTARPGYIFNHGTIGYGRLGVVGTSVSHSAQHGGAQRAFTAGGASKKSAYGIRLGAGLETFINPHLTIRGDYILDYIPGINIQDKGAASVKETIRLINNEFKLGLSWYVDP